MRGRGRWSLTLPGNRPSVADDDQLRSEYVWRLVQETSSDTTPLSGAAIPRVIVQYWHDSKAVPDDVQSCLDSWSALADQGFVRRQFDDATAREFIANEYAETELQAFDRCPHPAMRCDYFRLCYIFRHGGFYVDADEVYQGGDIKSWFRDEKLKIQPLCYEVPSGTMVPAHAFTTEEACSRERIYYVNNNPLIAPSAHPVIHLALKRSTRILLSWSRGRFDIQSTTGPGNLTRSLVQHSAARDVADSGRDFALLTGWDAVSISRWPLAYRSDERNWRLWRPPV